MRSPLFLFSILLGLFATSCTPYEEIKQLQVEGAQQDSLFRFTESTNINLSMFERGYRFLNITSAKAKTHQSNSENYTIFSGNVHISLYDSLFQKKSMVYCSTATYNNAENTFRFYGDVHVESENKKQLLTEELTWYRLTRKVETESYVRIYAEDDTVYGFGLVSDEALESYRIKRVSGSVFLKDEED
jgi:LPS export ABC transporter protein LptC